MYKQNDNTKVTVVAHSVGGPVSLYFLNSGVVTQKWKDTYIASYIPIAGAWTRINTAIVDIITGSLNLLQQFSLKVLRSLFRSWPGSYWFLPHESVWNKTVLVVTPSQNYTAYDYKQLFTDAGYPQGYSRLNTIGLGWPAPNVSTYCFYGTGFKTAMTFVYGSGFPDTRPALIYGDGDQIVNLPISEVCHRWASSSYSFNRTTFPGLNHFGILNSETVLRTIGDIVGVPTEGM